jgi:hypothetical protein
MPSFACCSIWCVWNYYLCFKGITESEGLIFPLFEHILTQVILYPRKLLIEKTFSYLSSSIDISSGAKHAFSSYELSRFLFLLSLCIFPVLSCESYSQFMHLSCSDVIFYFQELLSIKTVYPALFNQEEWGNNVNYKVIFLCNTISLPFFTSFTCNLILAVCFPIFQVHSVPQG